MSQPMTDAELFEAEFRAAHRAIDVFLQTLLEEVGPDGLDRLCATLYAHESLVLHSLGAPPRWYIRYGFEICGDTATIEAALARAMTKVDAAAGTAAGAT